MTIHENVGVGAYVIQTYTYLGMPNRKARIYNYLYIYISWRSQLNQRRLCRVCLKNGKSGSIVRASHSCKISQGIRSVEPSTSSAREQSGSTPQDGQMPSRAVGSSSNELGLIVRALSAVFSCRWRRLTIKFACG